jgi:GMP synthase PP-ATPase subunit
MEPLRYTIYIIYTDSSNLIDRIAAFPDSQVTEELMIEQLEDTQSVIFLEKGLTIHNAYKKINSVKRGNTKVNNLQFVNDSKRLKKKDVVVKRVKANLV